MLYITSHTTHQRTAAPERYLGHGRMGIQQGRDHLIEARNHRRRTNETVTNSGGLKISSKLIDVKLPPRSSALSFVDGRFNLGGMEGPGQQPMVRRTTRSTDE